MAPIMQLPDLRFRPFAAHHAGDHRGNEQQQGDGIQQAALAAQRKGIAEAAENAQRQRGVQHQQRQVEKRVIRNLYPHHGRER
jgi:hypothetical protein